MPGHDKPYDVPYMERTRNFYRAQGYTQDYQWALHENCPFTALKKPLRESRVVVITTSMPDTEVGRSHRQLYSTSSSPTPESMYTEELSWHKAMTHTQDVATFLPLSQLRQLQRENFIGSLANDFHSIPTEFSQSNTVESDAPEILQRCQQDHVDIALLVPL